MKSPTKAPLRTYLCRKWLMIVYKYHIFFTHSSIDGHVGCCK